MSDQHDKPVIPRFGIGPDGRADADTAWRNAPVDDQLTAGSSVGGEPTIPRYWTIGDSEPVASRDGEEPSPDDSIIVITPADIVSPAAGSAGDIGAKSPDRTASSRGDARATSFDDAPAETRQADLDDPDLGDGARSHDAAESVVVVLDDDVAEPDDVVGPGDVVESNDVVGPGDVVEPGDVAGNGDSSGVGGVTESGDVAEPASEADRASLDDRVERAAPAGRAVAADDERWHGIMVGFVDDPQASVAGAAVVVDEEIAEYISLLARRQEALRGLWRDDQDTETLRLALRSYRDFRKQLAESGAALAVE